MFIHMCFIVYFRHC